MNLNENAEELKSEEQKILEDLISRMDKVVKHLDKKMREYVKEAKNTDISINPDLYLAKILAQKGMRDTEKNRKKLLQARDELYDTRLLLHYKDSDGEGMCEVKVGLHSCGNQGENFVTSWKMPICRHYMLDNSSVEYESIVKDKHGMEHHTDYTLIVKNQVKLRFTRVVSSLNLIPGVFDDELLNSIKGTGFFSDSFLDEMIRRFNPDDYDPDAAAKIISDEFLQELLERRSTPEFKNIVFSIQKKQGEIIQAAYQKNMIVQGCAGSGKSMIMLHRLPIILYDNPKTLNRSNLYIITPSQMYIQMAENMRSQLEISDLQMGTIEQYYDYCIQKYPGHGTGEYGKISYHTKLLSEQERYAYSGACVEDIRDFLNKNCKVDMSFLEKASQILSVQLVEPNENNDFQHQLRNRMLNCQKIIDANNAILSGYYVKVRDTLDALTLLGVVLRHRKDNAIRNINKRVSENEATILTAQKEIDKLDPVVNAQAIENRKNRIQESNEKIIVLKDALATVDEDDEYFQLLIGIDEKLQEVLKLFQNLRTEYFQNDDDEINSAIGNIGKIIGTFFMISWELSKVEDKYAEYLEPIAKILSDAQSKVSLLQNEDEKYLEYGYFTEIKNKYDLLMKTSETIIKNTYAFIMNKIGIEGNDDGEMQALKCSPYLYLQVIYQYQGSPNSSAESFLSIDEAQGIASEEMKLLYCVNSGKAVFNMFGDVHQHIEGTKGIDSWSEFDDIFNSDIYEMQENYRNASQITEFCNRQFDMKMLAINTPGKGVHELTSETEFYNEMVGQLVDTQRTGLSAILVGSRFEAMYLLDKFSSYSDKFHDMTGEEFSLHRTRWNIINIDDAKGLEFSSVIVLSGRMSRNERYIAYTRAMDELFVYADVIDVSEYEHKPKKIEIDQKKSLEKPKKEAKETLLQHTSEKKTNTGDSKVREFFENSGFEVIDNRNNGGRLWLIGEKADIREIVNSAIAQFGITGKYASGKETKFRNGWYTKTNK